MFKIFKTTCALLLTISALWGAPVRKETKIPFGRPIDASLLFEPEETTNYEYFKLYSLKDTPVFSTPTLTSNIVKTISVGDEVYVYNELRSNDGSYFITNEGYIKHSDLTYLKEYVFYPISKTYYTIDRSIIVDLPFTDGNNIETLSLNDKVKVNGYNDFGYYRVIEPIQGFIEKKYLMEYPYVAPIAASAGGTTITPSGGVYYYNGRKETYYSSRVLYHYMTPQWYLDSEGFYHNSDGYYVVAASDMPFGTIFDCSKGSCIVLDCGCAPGVTDYYCNW